MHKILNLLPLIGAAYETLVHVIPTNGKNYSVVHKVFKTIADISNFFNREKPYKGVNRGLPILVLAIACLPFMFSCKNIECLHKSVAPVTYVTQDSFAYTVNVPYCDCIRIKKIQKPADTLKLK